MGVSFVVYVDESGDEGFKFDGEGQSSKWFVLSAIVLRKQNDLEITECLRNLRVRLGKPERHTLHFRDLKHEQKVVAAQEIAGAPSRTVSVICDKTRLDNPEYLSRGYGLYFYSVRFLLERVSWLCRDHRRKGEGDGTAQVVFSNRSGMPYDELRQYLSLLESRPLDVQVDWSVIRPDDKHITTLPHHLRAGLQAVDIVASSVWTAFEPNYYGNREPSYLREQLPKLYRKSGRLMGYGVKLWPKESEETDKGSFVRYPWLK